MGCCANKREYTFGEPEKIPKNQTVTDSSNSSVKEKKQQSPKSQEKNHQESQNIPSDINAKENSPDSDINIQVPPSEVSVFPKSKLPVIKQQLFKESHSSRSINPTSKVSSAKQIQAIVQSKEKSKPDPQIRSSVKPVKGLVRNLSDPKITPTPRSLIIIDERTGSGSTNPTTSLLHLIKHVKSIREDDQISKSNKDDLYQTKTFRTPGNEVTPKHTKSSIAYLNSSLNPQEMQQKQKLKKGGEGEAVEEKELTEQEKQAIQASIYAQMIPILKQREIKPELCYLCNKGLKQMVAFLNCSHRYHQQCIVRLLKVGIPCPICITISQ